MARAPSPRSSSSAPERVCVGRIRASAEWLDPNGSLATPAATQGGRVRNGCPSPAATSVSPCAGHKRPQPHPLVGRAGRHHHRRLRRRPPRPRRRDRSGPGAGRRPGRPERGGHLRPPPGHGRAAGVGSPAPDRPADQARAAGGHRLGRHRGPHLRRGPIARIGPPVRPGGAGRGAGHARRGHRRGLPLRASPRGQRGHAAPARAGVRLRGRAREPGRPPGRRRRAGQLHRDPPRPGRRRGGRGGPPPRPTSTSHAGWSSRATCGAACSASRRPTSRCPTPCAIPPMACTRAGTCGPSGAVHPCAINLGRRPTFYEHADHSLLEAHLLDFNGDLYGEPARVRFDTFLRSERKFDGIDALVAQLKHDVESTRRILQCPVTAAPPAGRTVVSRLARSPCRPGRRRRRSAPRRRCPRSAAWS